jgi:ribonuclease VapC
MVVDTSVLLAVLFGEPDAGSLLETLLAQPHLHLSIGSRLETSLVAEGSRFGAPVDAVDQLIAQLGLVVVPFDDAQLHWALRGWRLYGKGRHRAGLNLGDCFSYALAKALDRPLLFKGDDFIHTDVRLS